MADIEAIEVLQQAKNRILENGWGRLSDTMRDSHGDTESMCIEEGLCGRRGSYVEHSLSTPASVHRAATYLKYVVGLDHKSHLYQWNDGLVKSEGEVYDAIDSAILVAKEAPNPHSEV